MFTTTSSRQQQQQQRSHHRQQLIKLKSLSEINSTLDKQKDVNLSVQFILPRDRDILAKLLNESSLPLTKNQQSSQLINASLPSHQQYQTLSSSSSSSLSSASQSINGRKNPTTTVTTTTTTITTISETNKIFNFSDNQGLIETKTDGSSRKQSGFCEPYRGTVCYQVIGNQTIYVASEGSQDLLEEKIGGVFTVVKSSRDVSPQCSKFAVPSLCFSIFPLCSQDSHQPKPRQVCRDECEMLEQQICRLEYTIAKRHPLIGQQNLLPICENLAPSGSLEASDCVRLGVPNVIQVVQDDTCYHGSGENYRGTASATMTGSRCDAWHQQVFYKTADYPELIGGHNYCRNPGGMESQPWCFIRDPEMKKVLCDVPKCVDNFWLYIVAPALGALVFFLLLLTICCFRARKPRSKSPLSSIPSGHQTDTSLSSLQSGSRNSGSVEMGSLLHNNKTGNKSHAIDYPLSCLKFIEVLGEGAFGKVYRGELMLSLNDTVPIAIKTLKEDANNKTRLDFQREAELMADLKHPNIVCLLGVCFKEEPMSMLFEFMSEGDLHEYLITHSPRNEMLGKDGQRPRILDINDFLHISTQIGAGMEYLSGHHYVHRDLAARNCLVSDHLTVKISDFGLSRDIYASDYYRVHTKSLLPVRWMPPESILYGKFTTESDVWSFGVLLWEIFSYGLQPYYGYTNQQVIDMIRNRHLLSCPTECPPNIYSLMNQCWTENPTKRPNFTQLHQRLRNWKAVYSNTIASSTLPSSSSASHLNSASSQSGINLIQHHHHHPHGSSSIHSISRTLGSSASRLNGSNQSYPLTTTTMGTITTATSTATTASFGLIGSGRSSKDVRSSPLLPARFPQMNHQSIQQHFNGLRSQPFILNQHHFIATPTNQNSPSGHSNRSTPNMTNHSFKGHFNGTFN